MITFKQLQLGDIFEYDNVRFLRIATDWDGHNCINLTYYTPVSLFNRITVNRIGGINEILRNYGTE